MAGFRRDEAKARVNALQKASSHLRFLRSEAASLHQDKMRTTAQRNAEADVVHSIQLELQELLLQQPAARAKTQRRADQCRQAQEKFAGVLSLEVSEVADHLSVVSELEEEVENSEFLLETRRRLSKAWHNAEQRIANGEARLLERNELAESVALRDIQISEEEAKAAKLELRATKASGDVAANVASLRFAEQVAEDCALDLQETKARVVQLEKECWESEQRKIVEQASLPSREAEVQDLSKLEASLEDELESSLRKQEHEAAVVIDARSEQQNLTEQRGQLNFQLFRLEAEAQEHAEAARIRHTENEQTENELREAVQKAASMESRCDSVAERLEQLEEHRSTLRRDLEAKLRSEVMELRNGIDTKWQAELAAKDSEIQALRQSQDRVDIDDDDDLID
eukprot:gnl/MRDRNA2_/MRDRNA2_112911_c0_seq1.p1 gnl/MRDRNA2_/MRDRNA2_112911_c0~~gnl/MRDRNA2_/MRDRNA2_112911_c0_seq1.p1  ORF type:complete len:399 (+),score=134.12 gnl/MRDRNA2_/MRDRNA2_112911_c0_seq1:113-1309(+)